MQRQGGNAGGIEWRCGSLWGGEQMQGAMTDDSGEQLHVEGATVKI